ncbi:hypothetical protein [Deinococcus rufus]|uniref:Uncharacterized protein n=1 Tax=Deinococcus rufus TaxID=2136097 RepID=A0ABV7ZB49_9DEIO
MRRSRTVTDPRTIRIQVAVGLLVNMILLGLLTIRASNPLAVLLSIAMLVVVMFHAEFQGWGPVRRSAAGIVAGVLTFLVLIL